MSDQDMWLSKPCALQPVHWQQRLPQRTGGGSDSLPTLAHVWPHTLDRRLAGSDSPPPLPQRPVCLVHTLHVKKHIRRDRPNSSHCITSPSRCLDTLSGRKQNGCDTCKCLYSLQSNHTCWWDSNTKYWTKERHRQKSKALKKGFPSPFEII